ASRRAERTPRRRPSLATSSKLVRGARPRKSPAWAAPGRKRRPAPPPGARSSPTFSCGPFARILPDRGRVSILSRETFLMAPPPTSNRGRPKPPPVLAPDERTGLVSGSFWLSLGCTVTGATYLLAAPGEKYAIAYGAMIAGALAFGRGLKRWRGG